MTCPGEELLWAYELHNRYASAVVAWLGLRTWGELTELSAKKLQSQWFPGSAGASDLTDIRRSLAKRGINLRDNL
jgi:hypothetical protein